MGRLLPVLEFAGRRHLSIGASKTRRTPSFAKEWEGGRARHGWPWPSTVSASLADMLGQAPFLLGQNDGHPWPPSFHRQPPLSTWAAFIATSTASVLTCSASASTYSATRSDVFGHPLRPAWPPPSTCSATQVDMLGLHRRHGPTTPTWASRPPAPLKQGLSWPLRVLAVHAFAGLKTSSKPARPPSAASESAPPPPPCSIARGGRRRRRHPGPLRA